MKEKTTLSVLLWWLDTTSYQNIFHVMCSTSFWELKPHSFKRHSLGWCFDDDGEAQYLKQYLQIFPLGFSLFKTNCEGHRIWLAPFLWNHSQPLWFADGAIVIPDEFTSIQKKMLQHSELSENLTVHHCSDKWEQTMPANPQHNTITGDPPVGVKNSGLLVYIIYCMNSSCVEYKVKDNS